MRSVRNPAGTIFIPRPLRSDKCQLIEFARSPVDVSFADLDVIQNFSRCHDGRWGRGDGLSCDVGIADASRIKSPHLTLLTSFAGRHQDGAGHIDQIHAGVLPAL